MKLKTLKEMVERRENLIGFLHFSKITELNKIASSIIVNFDAEHKSFKELSDLFFIAYAKKELSNRQLTALIEIIVDSNNQIREEAYRYNPSTHELYELQDDTYVFLKYSTQREFDKLNYYL